MNNKTEFIVLSFQTVFVMLYIKALKKAGISVSLVGIVMVNQMYQKIRQLGKNLVSMLEISTYMEDI